MAPKSINLEPYLLFKMERSRNNIIVLAMILFAKVR
jgi:hypothetical protein